MNTQIHFFSNAQELHMKVWQVWQIFFFFSHIFSASKHLNGTEIKFVSDTETKEKHRERESEV